MKYFLVIGLLTFCSTLFCQKSTENKTTYSDDYYNPHANDEGYGLKTITFPIEDVIKNYSVDSISQQELELEFLRYCNGRTYRARKTTNQLLVLSTTAVLLPQFKAVKDLAGNDHTRFTNTSVTIGAGLYAMAIINYFVSERWYKYSSIKPSIKGLGVRITF